MKTAVIVTTYNRPDALAAVLAGFQAQSVQDFELLIADDGSTAATRTAIDAFRNETGFPVHHLWHEDHGFRAAAIRNRALAATNADYIIFTDGDCVPARDFVAQHRALAERGWFVGGNRILLSAAFSGRVLAEKLPVHAFSATDWLLARCWRDVNRLLPLLQRDDGAWRKKRPLRWEGVKTCNLGAWREDLVRVNGLDESYSEIGRAHV